MSVSPQLWELIEGEDYTDRMMEQQYIDKASVIFLKYISTKGLYTVSDTLLHIENNEVERLRKQFSETSSTKLTEVITPHENMVAKFVTVLMARVLYRWDKSIYDLEFKNALLLSSKSDAEECVHFHWLISHVKPEDGEHPSERASEASPPSDDYAWWRDVTCYFMAILWVVVYKFCLNR
ncbi:hypothetical protein ACH42_00530 [Endozoicomonas sp. (ex Bugula neritina AB1)]|nr:hypothetical protein ACH42_00530 [Endozoicomonas sp. (ex Bugula neritina AB1)]